VALEAMDHEDIRSRAIYTKVTSARLRDGIGQLDGGL
jgi:site-specific recombinase XerD